MPDAREALIQQLTVVAEMPGLPGLPMHLITEACELWRAGERELAALGLPLPFWAFCWPGGQALARLIRDRPELARGKRVLDFGSGGGVEALAALQAGAASALCADIDPFASAAARLNARLAGVELQTTEEDLIGCPNRGWDLVLGGDVFYDREMAERVLPWLRALSESGAMVLLGDPSRGFLPPGGLRRSAAYECAVDGDVSGALRRETTIWEVSAFL